MCMASSNINPLVTTLLITLNQQELVLFKTLISPIGQFITHNYIMCICADAYQHPKLTIT